MLILRQRSASAKIPGGPATASAKKAPEWRAGFVCLRTTKRAGHHLRPLPQVVPSIPQNGESNRSCAEGERSGRSSGALRSCAAVKCTLLDRTPALAGGPRDNPRHTPMSETFSKVEVITGVARRRRFPMDQKLAVVAETMQPGMSISDVARRHGLSPSLVFRWRRLMSEGGKQAIRADEEVVPASGSPQARGPRPRLERLLGRKTMEVEILKEALDLARTKKQTLLSRSPSPGDSP